MAAKEHHSAKKLCQAFFLNQIKEATKMYERISACECEHFGGKECVCTLSSDESKHDDDKGNLDFSFDMSNGMPSDDSHVKVRKDSSNPTSYKEKTKSDDCLDHPGEENHSESSSDDPQSPEFNPIWEIPTEQDSMASSFRELHFHSAVGYRRHKKVDWTRQMIFTEGSTVQIKPLIKQTSFDEQSYEGLRNPYIIIVNNVKFSGTGIARNGADADEENLKKFCREANFNSVAMFKDLKKQEMWDAFERTRRNPDLVNHDGLMCFLMSHGSQKGILTADHGHIHVDDITAKFQECPSLYTKPKLFFVQACRGDVDDHGYRIVPRGSEHVEADSDFDSEVPMKLPSDSDVLVVYSTTKGKSAYRQYPEDDKWMRTHMQSMGSWFIACLVQVILTYSDQDDLLTMLTRVNKAMSELYTVDGFKQVSCHLSMLTKKVFFPTIKKGSAN